MACLLAVGPLWGYVVLTDDSGVYVLKWHHSPVVLQIKLSTAATLIDGNSQSSSVVAAAQAWNAVLGTVQLAPQPVAPGDYALGNGTSEIVMDSTVGGQAFPSGALAITAHYTNYNDITEADIVFNSGYNWESYRGNLRRGIEDIQRVAIHELGHVIGLNHPDGAGQFVTAIMNSYESNLDALQSDDIAGGQKLYGAPGFVPANNNFANATLITLNDGTLQLGGSNIGADREDGEPNHAGSTGGHSVWWKWTAPSDGSVTIDTLGSNFDTALAIYTGASVSALITVVSNDDEETVAANPTPQRKRTSKVTFDAMGGTTYAVAVDGWGGGNSLASGYTGSVTLNLNFRAPPIISKQPADQTVQAGQVAGFSVVANGVPAPTYRWQRLQVGGSWADLSEGSGYSGTTMSELRVNTIFAMDGDQLRCVARNLVGSAVSNVVRLHVTPIPLPVIATQPQGGPLIEESLGTLSVQADRATSYQWFHDGATLVGQTGSSLLFPDPKSADAGSYYVVVSNPGGSVTSSSVNLIVLLLPVVANLSPVRQIVSPGQILSLNVSAAGTGALQYQWYHDGRPIIGATTSSFTRPVTGVADTGAYWIAVTDSVGTRYAAPVFVLLAHTATTLVVWGSNIGDPSVISAPTTAVAVSAGWNFGLALGQDGTVMVTGTQLGWNPWSALNDAVAVSVRGTSLLVLKADGTVVAGTVDSVPAGLKNVVAVACGTLSAVALRTDGTIVGWGGDPPPVGLKDVIAVAAGDFHVLALRRDGTVVTWGRYSNGLSATPPADLRNVVSIAGGWDHSLALKADGTVVAWGGNSNGQTNVPMGLTNVVAISAGNYHSLALKADGAVVAWGDNGVGQCTVPAGLQSVFAICAGGTASFVLRDVSGVASAAITTQPQSQSQSAGTDATLSVVAIGSPTPVLQWQRNGSNVASATNATLAINNVQPADTGLYAVVATSGAASTTSDPAILGVATTSKVIGAGEEIQHDTFVAFNGNTFDQVLVEGAAEAITADYPLKQITRTSFIDLNDDIVQVEFSGPGTLSLVLDKPTGPALPVNYNQAVNYMKGHAGIVITGATEDTNVSVFSVGKITSANWTPLAKSGVTYDGVADIAFIAIQSTNGKFGGVRTANASYFATTGCTGLYAPGVQFTGPVYIGDINASGTATPVLMVGSSPDMRITGGDLRQANGQPMKVRGVTQLKFTAGSTSHAVGNLPVQSNKAVLLQNGTDVTAQTVVYPSP